MILPNDVKNIILMDHSEPGIFAAGELRKYFKKITGKNLQLIHIDNSVVEQAAFVLKAGKGSNFDEFNIRCSVKEKRIEITGTNSRSLIYGVYFFLKKIFGASWNSPGKTGEILVKIDNLRLSDFHIKERAMLKYRGFYLDSSQYSINKENIEEIIDWMAKNSANFFLVSKVFYTEIKEPLLTSIVQRGIILEVGHHGFNCYIDPAKHFKKHPDWFSQINGKRVPGDFLANMRHNSQLCTSNKKVVDVYTESFMDFWAKNPEIDILGVIPNDGFGWCECEKCLKLEQKNLSSPLYNENLDSHKGWRLGSGRYHHFVKEVANKVNKNFPEKKMDFWAYAGVIMPSHSVSELPDNIILTIALYERWYNYSLNDPAGRRVPGNLNPKLIEILRQWRNEFQGEINIYEYYQKYTWRSMPKWMPEIIRDDTLFLKHEKVSGLLSMIEKDNFILYELNYLAHMAMSWSKGWTSNSFMDDYMKHSFGSMHTAVKQSVKEVISVMAPYAKLGPQYPENLTKKAEKAFKKLEIKLKELAKSGQAQKAMPLKSATKLRKWSKNMKLTHEHFTLTKLYYELSGAIEKKNAYIAIDILNQWKKAKKQFSETFRNLKNSGVCLSDDTYLLTWSKTLFEYEDNLQKELNRLLNGKSKDFATASTALKKLQDFAS